jgi:hypothetical protein
MKSFSQLLQVQMIGMRESPFLFLIIGILITATADILRFVSDATSVIQPPAEGTPFSSSFVGLATNLAFFMIVHICNSLCGMG